MRSLRFARNDVFFDFLRGALRVFRALRGENSRITTLPMILPDELLSIPDGSIR